MSMLLFWTFFRENKWPRASSALFLERQIQVENLLLRSQTKKMNKTLHKLSTPELKIHRPTPRVLTLATDGTMPTMWPLHTHSVMECPTQLSSILTSLSMEEM